ncbi:type I restriction endonuclease subunit S [Streptococcus suis]|uniref:restriction endonuclease subunit S n=1 Tax=Streptococcus suis TaxID=1307 RepID=UPI000CF60BFD|nr:restriction endonuclease subunit S [Streptococcus suis]AWX97090.1 type I restriction endonuclease subunit S [Streptococcus suis]
MTYIADLIKEHCPNGVEWKELGDREVAKLSRGKVMSKQFLEENKGVFPVYSSQTANSGEIGKISTFDFDGEYITWTTDGANAGTVFYRKGKFSITNVCGLVDIQHDKLLTKFVYYYLTITTKKYVSSGMGNPKLMSNVMAKIKIPIPPLKIQEEIVQILDKFTEYVTELTAELTAELTKRQKQYSFYRDKLLSFEDEVYQVEWKTLGEVGLPTENIFWKSQGEQCFSYIDLSSVDRDSKKITETTEITKYTAPSRAQKIVKENDIIFGTTRPTLRRYAKIPLEFDNQICSTGFYVFRASDEVLPDYIYHIFGSNAFNNFVEENQSGASYPAISNSLVEQYKLPVPSKKVQSRIVQVLDNFDAVCNDLNIGLPKEIEQRQKQYEYFREKLLTFTAEGVYPGQWTVDSERGPSDLIRLLQWVFGTIRVELGTICTFTRGNGLQKKDFTEEGYPVIHYGQIYTRYGFSTDKTISFTDQNVFAKLKKAKPGDIVMATTSENVEDVGKAVVWEGNEEVGIGGHSCALQTEQSSKFLVYYFQSNDFQRQKEKMVVGTKVIELYPKNIQKMLIVLPSLEEQSRIVTILDKFDELTTSISQGLSKEIELRQKQYEYFRDTLLNFSNKYE